MRIPRSNRQWSIGTVLGCAGLVLMALGPLAAASDPPRGEAAYSLYVRSKADARPVVIFVDGSEHGTLVKGQGEMSIAGLAEGPHRVVARSGNSSYPVTVSLAPQYPTGIVYIPPLSDWPEPDPPLRGEGLEPAVDGEGDWPLLDAVGFVIVVAVVLIAIRAAKGLDQKQRELRTTLGACDRDADRTCTAGGERGPVQKPTPAASKTGRLQAEEFGSLHSAILDAFNLESLRMMLRTGLNVHMDQIARNGAFGAVVSDVINWAEREGRVGQLVHEAAVFVPGNVELKHFATEFVRTRSCS